MQIQVERSGKTLPSRERVLEEVRQLVGEQVALPASKIREEQELIADLGYDSLDIVELAMELEEHFAITVPDTLSEEARTVGQVAHGVLQLMSADQQP